MKLLVTGGAGYIGSITATALEEAGHEPVILDSLVTGPRAFVGSRPFYEGDVADRGLVRRIFAEHPEIEASIHMAALIEVPESVAHPYAYYRHNVAQSLELFDELTALRCHRVVFSSSAAVYAPSETFEVRESDPVDPASPYARTKWMVEQVLEDLTASSDLRGISLRYFNPIGSDPGLTSGMHHPLPSHVLGQILLALEGRIDSFKLTGTNLPTRDGTGLRDFVHAWDLAQAHVRAVEAFDDVERDTGLRHTVLNVGTGTGTTVRELVRIVEEVTGRNVPLREAPARPGDVVGAFANVEKIERVLGWTARHTVAEAVSSAVAWADVRAGVLGS